MPFLIQNIISCRYSIGFALHVGCFLLIGFPDERAARPYHLILIDSRPIRANPLGRRRGLLVFVPQTPRASRDRDARAKNSMTSVLFAHQTTTNHNHAQAEKAQSHRGRLRNGKELPLLRATDGRGNRANIEGICGREGIKWQRADH
jgi:hypothetical protein